MRGAGRNTESYKSLSSTVHILDWVCKSQPHVTRSTFAAELLGAGDAVDQGLLINQMLHDVEHGVLSASDARRLRDTGGLTPMYL